MEAVGEGGKHRLTRYAPKPLFVAVATPGVTPSGRSVADGRVLYVVAALPLFDRKTPNVTKRITKEGKYHV